MVFGQKILRMCLKQLFVKVCTFLTNTTVVCHVSEPYNKTAFMLLLKILIFMSFLNSFELQMFLSIIKATLAFWILPFTSWSVPPFWSTTLPTCRYVILVTSSKDSPAIVIGSVWCVLLRKTLVLFLDRSSQWCWPFSRVLHSVWVVSRWFLCSHCQRLSHNLWMKCRWRNSIPRLEIFGTGLFR